MEKPVAVRMIETIQYYIIIAKVVRVPVPLPPGTSHFGFRYPRDSRRLDRFGFGYPRDS